MNKLTDKLTIITFCVISAVQSENKVIPVVAILLSIVLSSLNQVYSEKTPSLVTEIISLALCFAHPIFICTVPVIIYDILMDKRYKLLIVPVVAMLVNYSELDILQILIILCAVLVTYLLWEKTSRLEIVEKKLILTRDSSVEMNLLLKEKNKNLLEKQDKEIYLATLQERNRIAREIHDNVGHMLTRSILQVGALLIVNKDETQKESLASLQETLNSAMTSIRTSVHDLHDDSINFKMLIEEALKALEGGYKVNCEYDFSNEFPKKIKLCFIGVVRECVSNVVKHSNADTVNIVIREHPGLYQLTFSDNGSTAEGITNSGIGLINMRERVESIGGIINFNSSGNGFRVFISVPKTSVE